MEIKTKRRRIKDRFNKKNEKGVEIKTKKQTGMREGDNRRKEWNKEKTRLVQPVKK